MSLPAVFAVMLTRNRAEMACRAVECFRQQTYPADRRVLLVYDTSTDRPAWQTKADNEAYLWAPDAHGQPIGTLRNLANDVAVTGVGGNRPGLIGAPDILCHWDDDDWSHWARIAEQVKALDALDGSWRRALFGAGTRLDGVGQTVKAVGYNEMLFWNGTECWKYRGSPDYIVGTSLCYWRAAWERKPFPALHTGEDTEWQRGLRISAVSGVYVAGDAQPRMIGGVHPRNTTCKILYPVPEWKRTPEWDVYCERRMK